MKMYCRSACLGVLLLAQSAVAQTPTSTPSPPAVEIVSFKITSDYYPMLDSKPSTMSADNPDFPRPPNEVIARQNRRGGFGERNEELKARGKPRSTLRVISQAQWVNLALKNTGAKPIKAVVWDFAFVRKEEGTLLLRYEVSSQVEIKPGSKKNLKQPLPPGATRCQVLQVSEDATQNGKAKAVETVCGRGITDPSQLPEKPEPVMLKRIEYTDGSVWQNTELPVTQARSTTSVKEKL
jgi:hypothetical protein